MKRLRYRFFAWLDRVTGWRWANDAAWDAVIALHADALDARLDRLGIYGNNLPPDAPPGLHVTVGE